MTLSMIKARLLPYKKVHGCRRDVAKTDPPMRTVLELIPIAVLVPLIAAFPVAMGVGVE